MVRTKSGTVTFSLVVFTRLRKNNVHNLELDLALNNNTSTTFISEVKTDISLEKNPQLWGAMTRDCINRFKLRS